MSHLIDMSNGRANMAYVGEKPWHGLGHELSEGASLDQWRVEAGMNWDAKKRELYYRDDSQTVRKSESLVVYRSDNGNELGIVSDRYQIVQPRDVMAFFADLCSIQGFTMETAGCLDGGRKVWALARTGEDFRLMGTDPVSAYVLLATSFDGTLSTRAQFTSVRVVCNNTLQIARAEKGGIVIPHSTTFDAHKVKVNLGLMHDQFAAFEDKAIILAQRRVNKAEAVKFLVSLMAPEFVDKPEEMSTRQANIINDVYARFAGKGMGASLTSSNGTAWGLLNAVTEYVDHEQGNSVNNRFRSAQFGAGASLKAQAFDNLLTLAAA